MKRRTILEKVKTFLLPCKKNNYWPQVLRPKFLLCYLMFLLVLKMLVFSFFMYFPKTSFFAEISQIELIDLINQQREEMGLDPLAENSKLNKAAYLKAVDMLENDYFSHQSPQGINPWYWLSETEYVYTYAGENLAIGFSDSQELVDAWIDSPSHKENILSPFYQETGIAVLSGDFEGEQTTVIVQFFGRSKEAVPEESVVETEENLEYTIEPETEDSMEKTEEEQFSSSEEETGLIEETEEEIEDQRQIKSEVAASTTSLKFESAPIIKKNKTENDVIFSVFQMLALKYDSSIQKIIYFSFLFLGLSLAVTLFVRFDRFCKME